MIFVNFILDSNMFKFPGISRHGDLLNLKISGLGRMVFDCWILWTSICLPHVLWWLEGVNPHMYVPQILGCIILIFMGWNLSSSFYSEYEVDEFRIKSITIKHNLRKLVLFKIILCSHFQYLKDIFSFRKLHATLLFKSYKSTYKP